MAIVSGYKLVTEDYAPFYGNYFDHPFKAGSTHRISGPAVLCQWGFHFSPQAIMCLLFVPPWHTRFRLLKVEADAADVIESPCKTKCVTRELRVVEEVVGDDMAAALTGTYVADDWRISYRAGRKHQLADDTPAQLRITPYRREWSWFQNGRLGRCDGNPDLPVVAALMDDGSRRFEWCREVGIPYREGGKAACVVVAADGNVELADWYTETYGDDDDILSVAHGLQDAETVDVWYRHGRRLTVYRDPTRNARLEWVAEKEGTAKSSADVVLDGDGAVATVGTCVPYQVLRRAVAAEPTMLSIDYWLGVLESQRPPVDVIDVVLAAQ
jgi:hypothetical protein